MESEARAVLRLTDVVKTFPGVVALGGASLEVVEVHALLGENGAGKSTLMAVAAGALTSNSGSIEIGGQLLDEPTPARAQALGLSVVYQHTSVLDDLTVAENLLDRVPAVRRSAAGSSKAWVQKSSSPRSVRVRPAHPGQRPHRRPKTACRTSSPRRSRSSPKFSCSMNRPKR